LPSVIERVDNGGESAYKTIKSGPKSLGIYASPN
jgi:hypothetical protein